MVSLCVYSHSDFFDILKIQVDYIKSLNIACDIYLFVNTPFNMDGGKRIKYKSVKRRHGTHKRLRGGSNIKTILYDESNPYFHRLMTCIKEVNSDYIIFTHENNIILQFDIDVINSMIHHMKINKIDCIDLSNQVSDGSNTKSKIHIKDTLYIEPSNKFSVGPRIWRRESLLKLYSSFTEKSYHASENAEVQEAYKTYYKTYILNDINIIKSYYSSSKYYTFMHITHSGTIIQYNKQDIVDPIMKNAYAKIKKKYFNKTNRVFLS